MEFEYYVINWDHNHNRYEWFNVFQNYVVNNRTEKAIRKYLRSPKNFSYNLYRERKTLYGFEALCREIKSAIFCEENFRYEYEFSVTEPFPDEDSPVYKIDCAMECEKNIEMITRECIYQYKEWRKNNAKH